MADVLLTSERVKISYPALCLAEMIQRKGKRS